MTFDYVTRRRYRCFTGPRTRYHKSISVSHAFFKNYQATHCRRLTVVLGLTKPEKTKLNVRSLHGAQFSCKLSGSSDREGMANFVLGLNRVLIIEQSWINSMTFFFLFLSSVCIMNPRHYIQYKYLIYCSFHSVVYHTGWRLRLSIIFYNFHW